MTDNNDEPPASKLRVVSAHNEAESVAAHNKDQNSVDHLLQTGTYASNVSEDLKQIEQLWTRLTRDERELHFYWTMNRCATCGRKGTWRGSRGNGSWCDDCCNSRWRKRLPWQPRLKIVGAHDEDLDSVQMDGDAPDISADLKQIQQLWTKLTHNERDLHLYWTNIRCATCGHKGKWDTGSMGDAILSMGNGILCSACRDESRSAT